MTRATFFKHFELLADQPDAVAKMRELILNLAVRGKLIPQNPKDEPAEFLLKRIQAARASLHNEGKVKTRVEIAPIGRDESPYPIPSSWVWIPLNEIIELVYGKLLPTSELLSEGFDVFGANGIIGKYSRYHYEDEMLLISCRGAYSGTPNISPRKCYVTNNSIVCEFFDPALCDIRFFHAVISISPRENIVTGTAQPQVTVANAIKLPVPLPPLAEQRRIVAKVDELMALCDELEQRQQARQHASGILQQSALHHLLTAREPATFAGAWRRTRDHFHLLHDTPDAIPQLRQAILQLAVQGRLVPQNGSDKLTFKESATVEIHPAPQNWHWLTFADITAESFTGLERSKSEQSLDKKFAYLKMNNITADGRCDLQSVTRVDADPQEVKDYQLAHGDFLFNTRNSFELVGKTCVFEPNRNDVFLFNNNILKVIFVSGVEQRFVNLWFCSPAGRTELDKLKSSTTNVAAIYQGKLEGYAVPLPPLAEQKRIVARVEELLRWCDTLEAQLRQTRTLGAHLLASTLHHLLAA